MRAIDHDHYLHCLCVHSFESLADPHSTMKIRLILAMLMKVISAVHYNQPCTFSAGTCDWSIGRRWHTMTLDDQNKVLIADAESKEDKRIGFTDAIMSSWLHLSPLCAFDVRLTFRFSITHEHDLVEIYMIQKNRTRMTSLGQWKGMKSRNHSGDVNDLVWQHGNVTFQAAEEFRIDMEIRHLPDAKGNSIVCFAIDDILIENCPLAIANTTVDIGDPSLSTITVPTEFDTNESNATLVNAYNWTVSDSPSEPPSTRQSLLTLILYLFCALIALTLLIILFSIILFTYRKYCCPSSRTHRDRFRKSPLNNRIGIQVENPDSDYHTVKTIDSTVRPCFE